MFIRLLILLLLFGGVSLASGIYKWVDENGITVFSEKPPSGKIVPQVKLPPQLPREILEQARQEELRRKQLELVVPILPIYFPPAYPGGNQGSEENRRNYVSSILEGVNQGNADAQFYLGFMLEKGIGFSKNESEAAKWYRKAAEQENTNSQSDAQFMLALMYAEGRGVSKDNAEAMSWFGKVMKKKYANLFSESNSIIKIELRFVKDETELMKRYLREAEAGNVRAQSILGDMYAKGFGVSKNEVEAVKWYRKATEQGLAQGRLGFMYAEGLGVGKDYAEAMKFYLKEAENQSKSVESVIRMLYEFGPM